MKITIFIAALLAAVQLAGAYQYNVKGNQGWLSFDSATTLSSNLMRSGKDGKLQENFIDRGQGIADYGWYNLDTGAHGSFSNGLSASFSEKDRIGLYVKDNTGKVYISTKPDKKKNENIIWGKSRVIDSQIAVAGGNFGSNGTHEYYVFKLNPAASDTAPSGQPLPGIIATLAVGAGTVIYLKKRKKLYSKK